MNILIKIKEYFFPASVDNALAMFAVAVKNLNTVKKSIQDRVDQRSDEIQTLVLDQQEDSAEIERANRLINKLSEFQ